jgi:hypothetical protein|tara:strand:- start:575 stop:721 length:147 start_codon:yes stop_codon:yes gene_type:complete
MPRTKGKQSSRKPRKTTDRRTRTRRKKENPFLVAVINGMKKFLESPFK